MNPTERLGFWIVVALFAGLEAGCVVTCVIVPVGAALHWSDAEWALFTLPLPVLWALGLPRHVTAFRDVRRGRSAVRWAGFAGFAVAGAGLLLAVATVREIDYPNAKSPEVRAEMRAEDEQIFPWVIGTGLGLIAAGGLLLTPPVSDFLAYRRRVSAPDDPASDPDGDGSAPRPRAR